MLTATYPRQLIIYEPGDGATRLHGWNDQNPYKRIDGGFYYLRVSASTTPISYTYVGTAWNTYVRAPTTDITGWQNNIADLKESNTNVYTDSAFGTIYFAKTTP
jgi:hypothetical protein